MHAQAKPHSQDIYCDESGFSGNNLFLDDQPFYTYASVATDNLEALVTVKQIFKDFRINGEELKGSQLLKFNRGRKAIGQILRQYRKRMRVVIVHKKYNLACKFFEYIFEPVLAKKNSIFYDLGFHKFVAQFMYMHFQASAPYAEQFLLEFQQFMRLELDSPSILFGSLVISDMPTTLMCIRDFALCHQRTIRDELNHMEGNGIQKWVLDLTTSALFWSLASWGTKYGQLQVFCDASKPLKESRELFDVMINRKDHRSIRMEGECHPITFNLAKPIELVESKKYPGIQIADVVAAAFGQVYKYPHDPVSQIWRPLFKESLSQYSVLPDGDHVDLSSPQARLNALILEELTNRSRKGMDVLDGIEDYILAAAQRIGTVLSRD